MQYQTEIIVADDRYVCLQLPQFIPPGRAIVRVRVAEVAEVADAPTGEHDDPQHHHGADDVEWWEEFDAEDSDPDSA